jgi:hypothetical protein
MSGNAVPGNLTHRRINRRHVQFLASGIVASLVLVYGLSWVAPAYRSFSHDLKHELAYKALQTSEQGGPLICSAAQESCYEPANNQTVADWKAKGARGLSRALLIWQGKAEPRPWWKTPVAFFEANESKLLAYVTIGLLASCLAGVLVVRLLPASRREAD